MKKSKLIVTLMVASALFVAPIASTLQHDKGHVETFISNGDRNEEDVPILT